MHACCSFAGIVGVLLASLHDLLSQCFQVIRCTPATASICEVICDPIHRVHARWLLPVCHNSLAVFSCRQGACTLPGQLLLLVLLALPSGCLFTATDGERCAFSAHPISQEHSRE